MNEHAGSAGTRHYATILLRAIAVGGGYYLGAKLGLELRLPPATPSVLWPPNQILTAALLLTPPREWAFYLLAALPAHLVTVAGTGWPLSFILAVFFTNCSEAVIAGVGMRLFIPVPS